MVAINIWDELNGMCRSQYYQKRKKYFLWKNKMDTTRTTYSDKTEEDMRKILDCTDEEWNWLIRWEESEDYKRLMYILYASNFDKDLLDTYDAIKKSAMEGNSSAVKTMIDLQKEIKAKLKKVDNNDGELDLKLKV